MSKLTHHSRRCREWCRVGKDASLECMPPPVCQAMRSLHLSACSTVMPLWRSLISSAYVPYMGISVSLAVLGNSLFTPHSPGFSATRLPSLGVNRSAGSGDERRTDTLTHTCTPRFALFIVGCLLRNSTKPSETCWLQEEMMVSVISALASSF